MSTTKKPKISSTKAQLLANTTNLTGFYKNIIF